MNRKWTHWVLSGALLLGTHALRAQEPTPGPPPEPEMADPAGPVGPRMELLGFGEMHPGKVVTGAPYSALAVSETRQTLADGNVINRKVQSNVFRDSQGRTRRETTFTGIGPLAASGQPRTAVMIHDPVASTAYVLHPDQKTVEQRPTRARRLNKEGGNLRGKFEARIHQRSQRAGHSLYPHHPCRKDRQRESHQCGQRTVVFAGTAGRRSKQPQRSALRHDHLQPDEHPAH
jgi:hypothetical protein